MLAQVLTRLGLLIGFAATAFAWAPPPGYRGAWQQESRGARPADVPSATLLLHDADTEMLFSLSFRAEIRQQPGSGAPEGVWLRGKGQGFTADGRIIAREVRVDYYVARPGTGLELRELAGQSQAVARRCPDLDLALLTAQGDENTRKLTLVSFDRRATGQLTFDATWQQLGDDSRVTALFVDLFRGLTQPGGESTADQGTCTPTFSECFTAASEASRDTGIRSFQYSCDPETGSVTCLWTCNPSGG